MSIITQYSRTSARTAAKQKYNEKNYDQVKLYVYKGGRDLIKQLAELQGLSMAEYIKHLIIADATEQNVADAAKILGGGGGLTLSDLGLLP